jgi:xeroderma pigmentosum group C-complementing protein
MLPAGAVHIPRRGTVKICKRLGIDYAEAVTGFEFGYRMAVPVITGVVVAEQYLEAVMEQWGKDEAERTRKEDEKRQKAAIGMWRKMLMGLRIVERVREEYGDEAGHEVDALNPWTNNKKGKEVDRDIEAQRRIMDQRDEEMAGGFLPEGHDEEEPDAHRMPGFFPVVDEDDGESDGGFVVEEYDDRRANPTTGQAYATPQSLQSNSKAKIASTSDEEEEDVDAQSDVAPPVKRRGRPPKSTNKPAKAKPQPPQSKTPAKRSAKQQKTPTSNPTARRRRKIEDSEEDDETSSLSEPPSDVDSDAAESSKKTPNSRAKRTMPTTRKTPRRNAARKSVDAVRSHYFAHSDVEDDE